MKRFGFIVALAWSGISCWGQAVQKGSVVEMNSGGKPLAGVEIKVLGSVPTDTDAAGNFTLSFARLVPGARVVVAGIHKQGYEVVNEAEVKNWLISESTPFRIVMCPEGTLEASRRNFYDIGRDRYHDLYARARSELEQLRRQDELSVAEYEARLADAMGEYEENMKKLGYYADKFSRINKDELNELDARAMELMERGAVEEAIAVYEEAGIVEVFGDKIAQKEATEYNVAALGKALEQQVRLLMLKDDEVSVVRADSIMCVLERYYDKNPAALHGVALLYAERGYYEKACRLFLDALKGTTDRETGESIIRQLSGLESRLTESESSAGWDTRIKKAIDDWRYLQELKRLE